MAKFMWRKRSGQASPDALLVKRSPAGSTLLALLDLHAGESWAVGMLVVTSFFQGLSLAFLFQAANTLFLSTFAISSLPAVFVLTSVFLLLNSTIYSRYEARLSIHRFLPAAIISIFVATLALRAGMEWATFGWMLGAITIALMVWYRIASDVSQSVFWALSSLLFNVRESKRLFSLIDSGKFVATVLGLLIAPLFIKVAGAPNLLLLAAAAMLVSSITLRRIIKRFEKRLEEALTPNLEKLEEDEEAREIIDAHPEHERHTGWRGFLHSFKGLSSDPLTRQLGIFTVLSVVTVTCIDFGFLSQVESHFESQQQLSNFIGAFFAIGEVVAFITKMFLTGRVIKRFGVNASLVIFPASLLLVTLLSVIIPPMSASANTLLWLFGMNMIVVRVMEEAIHVPAQLILLQPFSPHQRLEAYGLIHSRLEPIALGLGGILLGALLYLNILSLEVLSYVLLALIIGWIVSAIFLKESYLSTLSRALKNRLLEGKSAAWSDPASVKILKELIQKAEATEPEHILYAIKLLATADPNYLKAKLNGLLGNGSELVRRSALRWIEEFKLAPTLPSVLGIIRYDPDITTKGAALRTYSALMEVEAIDVVRQYLEDPDQAIAGGAISGLLRYAGIGGVMLAGGSLEKRMQSHQPSDRAFAAKVIGNVRVRNFYHPLVALFSDPDLEVRRAAYQAAGKVRHPNLVAHLISALRDPKVQEDASAAIVEFGDEALPKIDETFEKASKDLFAGQHPHDLPAPSLTLRRLSRVLGHMHTPRSIQLLAKYLRFPDSDVRSQILQSLVIAHYRAESQESITEVTRCIENELECSGWLLGALLMLEATRIEHSVQEDPALLRLERALVWESARARERLLDLLSFNVSAGAILKVRENLRVGSDHHKANALEILDNVLKKELAQRVLPLCEAATIAEQYKALRSASKVAIPAPKNSTDALRSILGVHTTSDAHTILYNGWTRASAVAAIGVLHVEELQPTLDEFTDFSAAGEPVHALLRETAIATLADWNTSDTEIQTSILKTGGVMLRLERVMVLRTVSIFRDTPENLLADVAGITSEVHVRAGETFISADDVGRCMYIIVEGSVRVHRADFTLATLNRRDIVGELSMLDPEPRSATVTAIQDTHLLRIDQDPFYEIMADRIEVARGVLGVLCRRLRAQNELLTSKASTSTP
ncbi:MAG: MFS transporter [Candidatus Kapaibacterium sp.]